MAGADWLETASVPIVAVADLADTRPYSTAATRQFHPNTVNQFLATQRDGQRVDVT